MIEVGFIGLGRMGLNMVKRMLQSGKINVVVWNRSQGPVNEAVKLGAVDSESITSLVNSLEQKIKNLWRIRPAGQVTESVLFYESAPPL